MGLSGKQNLSEVEAAGQFVLMIANGIEQHWSEIAKDIKDIFPEEESLADDQYASFEFVLAVIACQIQALPNLLPADQAYRIRQYIIQCISSPELGEYPAETIQEYQNAWDQSLRESEPPFYGIAAVLFDKVGCQSKVQFGEASFKSPLLLMALAEKIVTFGGPWWKTVTEKYELVP